ncbi:hypothetical protein, partial [Pseudomonas sp. FW305-3-2-15-C-LB1]|uniref:hypothetical protein n=1 Tax=Pseudomonas sp. FW305-3-2-15-C-LB1 TaxID=2751331 RepID=UPI001C4832CD
FLIVVINKQLHLIKYIFCFSGEAEKCIGCAVLVRCMAGRFHENGTARGEVFTGYVEILWQ